MKTMEKELDLITLGIVAMDYYLFPDSFSPGKEKIWAGKAGLYPGGTMGNVAAGAAKLGLKTGFVGVVGKDLFGEELKKDLEACGVDVSRLVIRRKGVTPVPVIIQDRRKVRTIIIPPFMHIRSGEVDWAYLGKGRILHTHLFDFDLCLEAARTVEKTGTGFSLDLEVQRVRDLSDSRLNHLLRRTQWLFLNRETLETLQPGWEPMEAAKQLKARGPKTVIVTLGAEGSLAVSDPETVVRIPSPKVKAVDATGAGDGFAAAFFYGLLIGWPLEKTLVYASAAAAQVVQHIGARTGQPNLQEFLQAGEAFSKHISGQRAGIGRYGKGEKKR